MQHCIQSFISKENAGKASCVGVAALPGASACKHWREKRNVWVIVCGCVLPLAFFHVEFACLFSQHHVNHGGVQNPKPETLNPKSRSSLWKLLNSIARKLLLSSPLQMRGSICCHRTRAFWCGVNLTQLGLVIPDTRLSSIEWGCSILAVTWLRHDSNI